MHAIETRRFGMLSIRDDSVISFPDGIIGFPRLREFAILGIEEYLPFLILASLDNARVCFPMVNPDPLFPNYDPLEGLFDVDDLIGRVQEQMQVYCLVAFVGHPRSPVANLRNPLIVDVSRMAGVQISLPDANYGPRMPIDLGEMRMRTRSDGGA